MKSKNKHLKYLSIPYRAIEHIFRHGWLRYTLYQIALIPSLNIRKSIYKCLGCEIDKNVIIHFKTEIRAPWNLKIGRGTIIGDNALLDARCCITLGENVNLSSNVSIYTLQHDHRDPQFRCQNPKDKKMSIEINNRAWIGSNVIILPGVHIGEGAVCCAGSIITKDVPPFGIVAGIPAKIIGTRNNKLEYIFNGKSCRLY